VRFPFNCDFVLLHNVITTESQMINQHNKRITLTFASFISNYKTSSYVFDTDNQIYTGICQVITVDAEMTIKNRQHLHLFSIRAN